MLFPKKFFLKKIHHWNLDPTLILQFTKNIFKIIHIVFWVKYHFLYINYKIDKKKGISHSMLYLFQKKNKNKLKLQLNLTSKNLNIKQLHNFACR
jgi:hypothetical protein